MKYFYDCAFLEDGLTVDLISIGIVAENGDEYYAVNRDAPWRRVAKHPWLVGNVVPSLPHGYAKRFYTKWTNPLALDFGHPSVRSKSVIAYEVLNFLLRDGDPELWAWYAAYDHVCYTQLWGPVSELPYGLPMRTNDLTQEHARQGYPALPDQASGEHHALDDARHNLARARAMWLV
jgi:hypothetical protein